MWSMCYTGPYRKANNITARTLNMGFCMTVICCGFEEMNSSPSEQSDLRIPHGCGIKACINEANNLTSVTLTPEK